MLEFHCCSLAWLMALCMSYPVHCMAAGVAAACPCTQCWGCCGLGCLGSCSGACNGVEVLLICELVLQMLDLLQQHGWLQSALVPA